MVLRFAALIFLPPLAFSALLFRLYEIQIVGGRMVSNGGNPGPIELRYIKANRGVIFFTDKNGKSLPAVLNKDFPTIYAVPKVMKNPGEAAKVLSPFLGRQADELIELFSRKDDEHELLLNKADAAVADKIKDLKIPGIYVEAEPGRFYPQGPLLSHVLGFVGPSDKSIFEVGRYGIEIFYEDKLAGRHGASINGEMEKPTPGEDVILTIDPNIQIEAEKILENLITEYRAKGGSVIVVDPATGKILAMGSFPDFDPNIYGEFPVSRFLNPAIQSIYEPGSVFKPITMAAGIDSGKITPETAYYDKGTLTINGRTISNFDFEKNGAYGKVTMTKVIERSINTGAVFAQREMGREIFEEYVRKFGFGETTGVNLPGEIKGDLGRLNETERDIAFATASYGQGIAVTPLGMINAFAAIANGGKLMRPYLDAELKPKVIRMVIGKSSADQVTKMMVSAVDKAEVAKIKGYSIAGKTGTAYVPDFKNGGYTDNVINTFAGFGPASNPKFVALIKLDEPENAPLAALTVVPAFRNLAQFILNYYNVEPDRL